MIKEIVFEETIVDPFITIVVGAVEPKNASAVIGHLGVTLPLEQYNVCLCQSCVTILSHSVRLYILREHRGALLMAYRS